jgi:23S rRNA (pseudouridine1915-N3)-methyltransferase
MKLRIVALGQRMPVWVDAAFIEYAHRLRREFALELVELKPEPRGRGKTVAQVLAAEARRVAAATKGWRVVALDERGEAWTTARFAERLLIGAIAAAVAFVIEARTASRSCSSAMPMSRHYPR